MLTFYFTFLDNKEDEPRYEELIITHEKLMKYTAYDYLHDDFLSEDAVSEAYIRIARHMDGVGEINCPKTRGFVVKIVKNICIDMLRTESKYNFVAYDDNYNPNLKHGIKQDIDFAKIEFAEFLEKIKELPEIYRDVLLYKFEYGYYDREIADMFGVSYAAVRKRIQRAKELLAYSLRDWRK